MTENILAQMRTVSAVTTRENFPETELSLGCKISFTAQCDRRYCGKGFILFVVSFQDILCVQKVHYLMGLKVVMHLHVVTKHIL